MDLSTVGP